MRMRSILPVFVAALVAVVFTADAMAMYHPGLGRYVQRDPHGTAISPNRVGGTIEANSRGFITSDQINPPVQYQDGLNLYQYVKSSPLVYVDPIGLWTEATAKTELGKQIREWRGKGWTLAANLLQHFADKKGPTPYIYSSSDINHVKSRSRGLVRKSITGILIGSGTLKPFGVGYKPRLTISYAPKNNSSNQRWAPTSAMWAAYGGVQLRMQGVIDVARVNNRSWNGEINVNLRDYYNFKENYSYQWLSDAYDAGVYLHGCGYKAFWHDVWFKENYSGTNRFR